MDVAQEFKNIINAVIAVVRNSQDTQLIKQALRATHSLLLCLDDDKKIDYKMALIAEYLEGISEIVPEQHVKELYEFINGLHASKAYQKTYAEIAKVIESFSDRDAITPPMVVFWLQRSCDLHDLNNMHALMLFLHSDEQQKILKMDKEFMQDPRFEILKKCLPSAQQV